MPMPPDAYDAAMITRPPTINGTPTASLSPAFTNTAPTNAVKKPPIAPNASRLGALIVSVQIGR